MTLMEREDPLFFPLRLVYQNLSRHSRIFLKRQAPPHRNPLLRQPVVDDSFRRW